MKKIIILIIIFLFPQNVFADENIEKKQEKLIKKFVVLYVKVKA